MPPLPHRATGPCGAMARPHQAEGARGGYLLPRAALRSPLPPRRYSPWDLLEGNRLPAFESARLRDVHDRRGSGCAAPNRRLPAFASTDPDERLYVDHVLRL